MSHQRENELTPKQKEKGEQLEENLKEQGFVDEEAERRAWQAINSESGGDKKSDTRHGDRE